MRYRGPARAKGRTAGFTLIEVLLAVSVFALVLAAINTVFFGALRLRNKTSETFETALPLQQTLGILQKDLEGIMLPGGRLAGTFTTTTDSLKDTSSFVGERVTPDIYTSVGMAHTTAAWADVQKVAYFLAFPTNQAGNSGGKSLVRQITRNLLPVNYEEPESQWLMDGLQTLRLQFYDGLTWTETWDSSITTNLPQAIKVQITLAQEQARGTQIPAPIELIVPIAVQASTNLTAQTGGGAG